MGGKLQFHALIGALVYLRRRRGRLSSNAVLENALPGVDEAVLGRTGRKTSHNSVLIGRKCYVGR